jgi:hypothetical protein
LGSCRPEQTKGKRARDTDRELVRIVAVAQPAFAKVRDNPEDDVFNDIRRSSAPCLNASDTSFLFFDQTATVAAPQPELQRPPSLAVFRLD